MAAPGFFQDTALTATIRLFRSAPSQSHPRSNGKNEQCPQGGVFPASLDDSHLHPRDGAEAVTVGWTPDCDPQNPHNWPTSKKTFISILICLYTFTVYCGSSIYVPGVEQVMEEFGVSEAAASLGLALYVLGYGLGPLLFSPLSEIPFIGRNPIYITTFFIYLVLSVVSAVSQNFAGFLVVRFLQGFFGSPCLATGAASLSDMFSAIKVPYAMAAWSGSMYAGPALGPVISAFAVTAKGWRWSMWEIVWLSGLVFVLLFVFLPETSTPTLLYYKAKRLRQETGLANLHANGSADASSSMAHIVQFALIKPFEITIKDPAIAFTNFYLSLTYGIYYSFFEAFPLVYPEVYGMNLGESGAVFLCILIACIIGVMWYCLWYRLVTEPDFQRRGGFDVPEAFLKPGLVGVFGVTAGLFLYGWAARASVPWPVPTLGVVFYCGCSFVVGLGIFLHLPLSYPQYAASLFAANDALRSSFAAGAILFGRPLYVGLGIARGCSLLGGISVIGIFGFWYLYWYGESLRKRSKFTVREGI